MNNPLRPKIITFPKIRLGGQLGFNMKTIRATGERIITKLQPEGMAEILGMEVGMRLLGVADKLIYNMSHKQIIWDIKKHQTPEESSLVPDGTSKEIFTKLKL